MKAHEEEWYARYDGRDWCIVSGRSVLMASHDTTDADLALASAAPDMARALLGMLPDDGHTMECANLTSDDSRCSTECRNARAALKKAGVI